MLASSPESANEKGVPSHTVVVVALANPDVGDAFTTIVAVLLAEQPLIPAVAVKFNV